jgi:hypothetical protein
MPRYLTERSPQRGEYRNLQREPGSGPGRPDVGKTNAGVGALAVFV